MTEISNYGNIYYPSNNNSSVIKAMLSGRTWEKKIIKIFREYIKKNDVVVDVGSYIGLHSFEMSKLAKKVYSFEPQPLISACVMKSLEGLEITNVDHRNMAIGDYSGQTFIHSNNDGDSSLEGIRDHKFKSKYECRIERLDDMIKEKISFIKCDVEGSEFQVLAGAKNLIELYKPIIIIETFKTKRNLKLLDEFCEGFDYDYEYISGDNYLLTPI